MPNYLLAGFISVASLLPGCAQVQNDAQGPAAVVLLHGAHLTAGSWGAVKDTLSHNGLNVVAVDLPGRKDAVPHRQITLTTSSRSLCDLFTKLQGNITVVAHSQAGAIVNHASSICPSTNIQKIIYLAAVVPASGEKPFEKLSKEDETRYLNAVAYDAHTESMKIFDQSIFWRSFGVDPSATHVGDLKDQSVDEPAAIGEGLVELDSESFSKPKKFYIFTKKDQIISLPSQRLISAELDLADSAVIDSGHAPMITNPKEVAAAIMHFVRNH